MAVPAKFIKKQLAFFKPFADGCSIGTCRIAQQKMGELAAFGKKAEVTYTDVNFEHFSAGWIHPKELNSEGVILFLHGGGYVAGDLRYAKGFGTMLAVKNHTKVFCPAYRLAPENPFPAAVKDALCAYKYLLKSGYEGRQIVLCGESAGGGLIYSLVFELQRLSLPLPGGMIAISPWVDLTMTAGTYESNRDADPSMSRERLIHYAKQYTDDVKNPLASPLFGKMENMPPSLIFAGNDEVMRDDAVSLHQKLMSRGNRSKLIIAPGMWHVYILFGLKEREQDETEIQQFIAAHIQEKRFRPRWMKLDNAAKIYPAAMRRNWSNVFRESITLKEKIDPDILQSALEVTVRRFPSMAVRMRRGAFWYYLEQLEHAPAVQADKPYPIFPMKNKDIRTCAFRVLYYQNRIALELFHALTDGNGALVFLKTLGAEYIEQKYGREIPAQMGVLDRAEEPAPEELEDSFLKYSGEIKAGRKEATAYRLTGTKEPDGYKNLVCMMMDSSEVRNTAHQYKTTVTGLMVSVLTAAIADMQNARVPARRLQKPVKILVPVNLRSFFKSSSLRNFVLYITPGIDPRMGEYTFEEIVNAVNHQMGLELTDKKMSAKITANVKSEKIWISRIMPLFIKNAAMKLVYNLIGERKSCLTLSNLGQVEIPEEMQAFTKRFDFILGVQATTPCNCGMLSYAGTLYMNFIRNIKEPLLERKFYEKLKLLGIHVKTESNGRG